MDSEAILGKIKDSVIETLGSDLLGLVLFGSFSRHLKDPSLPYHDIDILIVIRGAGNSALLREKKRQVFLNLPEFEVSIQLWVWSELQWTRFSPLHVGIALDAKILFEVNDTISQVLQNTWKIMHEWGTRREWIDGKWVIFMKGKPLQAGESLMYGQMLVGV